MSGDFGELVWKPRRLNVFRGKIFLNYTASELWRGDGEGGGKVWQFLVCWSWWGKEGRKLCPSHRLISGRFGKREDKFSISILPIVEAKYPLTRCLTPNMNCLPCIFCRFNMNFQKCLKLEFKQVFQNVEIFKFCSRAKT